MTEQDKGHIDVVGFIGGTQLFLGHADVSGEQYDHKRFRQIADLLHTIAWELEEEADKFEGWTPRCLKNSIGDLYFEVAPNVFVDGDDRREAETLYLAGTLTNTEDELRGYYPEIELVAE
jgi:hypothetical protein